MSEAPPVLRRHVFFIGGFTEGGPAFYRRYLEREAARHRAATGCEVTFTDLSGAGEHAAVAAYAFVAERREGTVRTRYDVLRWEDIVLRQFARPWSTRVRQALATFCGAIASGQLLRMFRLMRRFAFIWLFPFLYYGGVVAAAAALGLAAALALKATGLGDGAAFLSGFAAAGLVLLGGGAHGRRSFAYLLLNDFLYGREIALGRADEIWTRVDEFADAIAAGLRHEADTEMVLVGHSFGASLAPMIVARLDERHPGLLASQRLVLLTLGGSLPLIGFHPAATRFRDAVRRAAAAPVRWIDVSSAHDAINFKRFDPVAGLGLEGPEAPRPPLLLDTRFGSRRGAKSLRQLGFMHLHMQFIMASDEPGTYDYIGAITAARPIEDALTLAAGRPSNALDAQPEAGRPVVPQPARGETHQPSAAVSKVL